MMKSLVLIFMSIMGLLSCAPIADKENHARNHVIGVWESDYSKLVISSDGSFVFTPHNMEDKPRGGGVWEPSDDGGFYFRYRARNSNTYISSEAEYFRLDGDEILFYHVDWEERFSRKS